MDNKKNKEDLTTDFHTAVKKYLEMVGLDTKDVSFLRHLFPSDKEDLGAKPQHLSAVFHGKKPIPSTWMNKIKEKASKNLNYDYLRRAAVNYNNEYKRDRDSIKSGPIDEKRTALMTLLEELHESYSYAGYINQTRDRELMLPIISLIFAAFNRKAEKFESLESDVIKNITDALKKELGGEADFILSKKRPLVNKKTAETIYGVLKNDLVLLEHIFDYTDAYLVFWWHEAPQTIHLELLNSGIFQLTYT